MEKKVQYLAASAELLNACDLCKSEDSSAPPLPKFRIHANAGSRMTLYDGDYVIDLAGAFSQKDARAIPILYGHDWDKQLGHATVAKVDETGVWLEGVVSVPSYRADAWVQSAKNGFPWQASLGFMVREGVQVRDDEEYEINGRVEKGPFVAATSVEIWECSVVTFGADDKTEADIEARDRSRNSPALKHADNNVNHKEGKEMPIDNKTPNAPAPEPKKAENAEGEKKLLNADAEIEKLRAARVAENERIDKLEALAKKYDDREFLKQAISEGWNADRFELETLRHARAHAPAPLGTPKELNLANVAAAAMLRVAGRNPESSKRFTPDELQAASRVPGYDFRAIFEAATGFTPNEAQRANVGEWLTAASNSSISTYNLNNVLSVTGDVILEGELGVFERRWEPLFRKSSVSDFKKAQRYRLDSSFMFDEIPEGAEMTHGTQKDEGWEIQVSTYGKQYVIGRKSLINGEALGVFSDIMQKLAIGATQRLNHDCWNLILNPGNASDGTAFYHANHGSLITSKPLTLANLGEAISAFMIRKKGADTPLGIEAKYLLVPPSLLPTARNIITSTEIDSTSYEGKDNPMKGIVEILTAPELEFAAYTGSSATTWYLFADPNALAAFEIAYLNGVTQPTLRSGDLDIGRLGIAIDGFFDFGIALRDYRAALKATA